MVSLFKRPWIETVKLKDLEKERLKIDNEIQVISKEIERLEAEKKGLFKQGIGKSDIEKILLAEKIRDIDDDIKMRLRDYQRLIKQRRAISNLIRLKKWEARLKEKGVWDKIREMSQQELISRLSEVEITEKHFEENIDKINEVFATRAVVKLDSETQEILRLWEKVERAELSAEDVEEKLAVKLEAEKEKKEEG